MTHTWELFAAAFIGGFSGAVMRDLWGWFIRSDWLFRRIIAADVRAIGRAQRKAKR